MRVKLAFPYGAGVARQSRSEAVCAAVIEALREERLRKGLSMNRVAQEAGLSQQMVSYVERGMRAPTLNTAVRIAEALEVDLGKIITKASRVMRQRSSNR
jgi:transcriptional regulator with XRE-family HTH domain